MSDFLTNLVSRSFGTAPVVRPRLTSLFEPVREDAAKLRNTETRRGETLDVLEDEALAETTIADDRKPRSRVEQVAANRDQHDALTAQDQLPVESVVTSLPRVVREPRSAAPAERIESKETNLLEGAPIRRDAPDRAVSVTTITEREHPVQPALVAPVLLSSARGSQADRQQNDLLISPRLSPEMRLPDLALSARTDRKSRERARDLPSGTLQPSEQTVNVTIGRIEVRATKESARSTRPTAPSPVMSLDEYLRNRARQAGS